MIELSNSFGLAEEGLEAPHRTAAFFMEVKATKIGDIKGDAPEEDQKGKIAIFGWQYAVASPRDTASGLATGKRRHYPIQVSGKVDKATPLLFKALTTNDTVAVKIHCRGPLPEGGDGEIYLVETERGSIAELDHFTRGDGTMCYRAAFTFSKITITHKLGNITGEDDWSSSV
jgi:type VI secretion system secreted protein Hcp